MKRELIKLNEMGQGLVEYVLIVILIAIFLIVGMSFLAEGINDSIFNIVIANI